MMKATLSAIGLFVAAAVLFATTGAQESGAPAPPANNAVGSRVTLAERVRGLLASSGVEVGAAANPSAPARSPTQVVVVALDSEGRMRWCGLVADPRLLRAEVPGPDGELTGQVIYRESAEFVVQYPDDEAVTEVRLYH